MDKIFEYNLRFALGADEWDSVKDSPDEWVRELYPEVIAYGGSYYHIEHLLGQWRESGSAALKYLKLVENKENLENKLGKTLDGKRYLQNLPENKSIYDALYHLEDFEKTIPINVGYFFEEITGDPDTVLQKLSSLSKETWDALSALQVRHYITASSVFTLTDYNALTSFVRKNWGQIHPDDDPVLGMTVWPSLGPIV